MSQRARLMILAIVVGMVAVQGGVQAQAPAVKSPLPLPSPYRLDESFKLEMPQGLKTLGSVSAVKIGPDNNLYVFHRCVENSCTGHNDINPILVYNQQGKLLRQMGKGMFVWPHGLQVMPDGSLWVTDAVAPNGIDKNNPGKGHQVFHLDKNGKVLLALGKPGVAGAGHDTFNAPSDVLIGKNGDIFVFDGHGEGTGTRVVKFNSKGEYIKEWGGKGGGPGQLEVPHAAEMDSQGRIFVADRPNNRIQIFDQDGKLLAEWRQFGRPSGIAIDRNDNIYVTDTQTTKGREGFENGIYIGSAKDGKVTGFIPKIREHSTWEGTAGGNASGTATNMEAITVTNDGNTIFGGEVGLMNVFKFVRTGSRATK
jgi:NHL repeat